MYSAPNRNDIFFTGELPHDNCMEQGYWCSGKNVEHNDNIKSREQVTTQSARKSTPFAQSSFSNFYFVWIWSWNINTLFHI